MRVCGDTQHPRQILGGGGWGEPLPESFLLAFSHALHMLSGSRNNRAIPTPTPTPTPGSVSVGAETERRHGSPSAA